MTFPYSRDFDPPAPVLNLEFLNPASDVGVEVMALIDSGAEISVIPSLVVSRLQLRQVGAVAARGVYGRTSHQPVFRVVVHALEKGAVSIEATTWSRDYALLGRDVINGWKVTLDGPGNLITIA